MKKLLFILNPTAGTRKAGKVLPQILSVFNRAQYDVFTYVTACAGDGRDYVAKRAGEMDLIVCCGGDGTFNETVTGLLHSGANVPLGYIPAGSTNDFASSLGLSTDPVKAAEDIVNGKSRPYDVGLFGDRHFTYVASFGAFTRTSYSTPQSVKNALGHTAYMLSGITELGRIKKLPVRVELDGETLEGDYLFGAVCNSTSIGGIAKLDPSQVDMSDGLFEMILVRSPKSMGEITECISAVRHQTYNCRMITFRTAKKVTFYPLTDLPWTLDGEMDPGGDKIVITNLQHAIHLVK